MDADMVCVGDIKELFDAIDMNAVSVVQDQPKFEWPSLMAFQCGACRMLTPEYIDDEKNKLFDMAWAPYVGKLPREWNHCVGYADELDMDGVAKLYHFTQGLPCWYETRGRAEDAVWEDERKAMVSSVSWKELMGRSVHAEPVLRRLFERLSA